jgi:hypothetical protein
MSGEVYKIKDDLTGELEGAPGIFVVGNAVTGRGNILVSRKHGRTVSQRMIEQYLLGVASGYEEVFQRAENEARGKIAAVADRLSGQAPLQPEKVADLLSKIELQQKRVGYSGNYRQWIDGTRTRA